MFFSMIARRARRVLLCLIRSIPKALAISALTVICYAAYQVLFKDGGSISYSDLLMLAAIGATIGLIVFSGENILKYKNNIFHRFDDDIIGTAFTGLNHRSAIFGKGVELFHKGNFRNALEIFTDLGMNDDKLSKEEQSVNEFYRGRCYHILEAFPNAIICYENAMEKGFSIPELPIFIARCNAENGSTQKAEELLIGLMDKDYKYYSRIRCEIGNMYLKLNDGETALKWFNEAIERREQYANALGGAAIAQTLLHNIHEGEELYRQALLNHIEDSIGFTRYYKEVQAAVMLEHYRKK